MSKECKPAGERGEESREERRRREGKERGEGERRRREEEERGGEKRGRGAKEEERRSNMATNIHTRSFHATTFPEGLVKVWIVSYRADVLHIVWD